MFLYICELRSSCLLDAKFYTARGKNSFESANLQKILQQKALFISLFHANKSQHKDKILGSSKRLTPIANSLLGHTLTLQELKCLKDTYFV